MFFFSSRRRQTGYWRDWSSDVCSSDLGGGAGAAGEGRAAAAGRPGARGPAGGGAAAAGGGPGAGAARHGPAEGGGRDRKSVVSGKSVDIGGRRIIQKNHLHLMLQMLLS